MQMLQNLNENKQQNQQIIKNEIQEQKELLAKRLQKKRSSIQVIKLNNSNLVSLSSASFQMKELDKSV